jgi:hypothetical protein
VFDVTHFQYQGSVCVSSRVIFFLLVVIYRNTLNQRQYVLSYTECPSEGGIAEGGIVGCGTCISLQSYINVQVTYTISTSMQSCR